MSEMKIGKYTVTGRVATDVSEEEKEAGLRLLMNTVWEEVRKIKKKEGEKNEKEITDDK